jgi:hypothetical protein
MLTPGTALVLLFLGELPLPDATLYGTILTETGLPVAQGTLKTRIFRGGALVLEAAGSLKQAEGTSWYVVNVLLETAIGAPGPSGIGAHEGDVVESILLNGKPVKLEKAHPSLAAGAVSRANATVTGGGGPRFYRGDCSPDLTVDISDALAILSYLFLGSADPPCVDSCDSDGSGEVDITDAVSTLSFLFLGGPEPPAPGPRCGVDDTPSDLGCVRSPCNA